MIGNHSISVIAEAYAKGFRSFDAEAAYQAMRDTAMQDRNMLGEYRKQGYVPSADRNQSVSRTLEFVYDDWCIAEMARLMGKTDDAALFAKRAENYRNVFDPSVASLAASRPTGKWTDAVRSARNSCGPTIPRPPPGTTPGSCSTTCRG